MEKKNTSSSAANVPGDSLNGLKFGKKIYFEDVACGGSSAKSMSALGRKGKGSSAVGAQQKEPRCQVEGCNLDLSGMKAYYSRHKVCGMHSKSPRVVVAGLEQRFCQQCSRFHLLSEFDQGKRSCRRRLAGHNERRRKPTPGPFTSRYSLLSSLHEDNSKYQSFLMDFSRPKQPGVLREMWPTIKSGDQAINNQWQGNFNARVPNNHQYLSAPEQTLDDCFAGIADSNCALSLLSTQPWGVTMAAATPSKNHGSQLNMASSYTMNSTWAFRDQTSGSSSFETGLKQLPEVGNGHFSGELELALHANRQCPDDLGHRDVYGHDHSSMHWSL